MPRLKYAGLALLALFSFSILASIPNAWSLSPITFTTTDTATSINQQFQRVYENGTNSVIMLDTNNAGEYFKEEYSIAGQTVSSLDTTVTSGGDTTDSDANASPVDLSRYALSFNGSDEYGQAGSAGVWDITTQDFSSWGLLYRTADTGGTESIISKASGAGVGYDVFIDGSDNFVGVINDGTPAFFDVSSTVALNTWYAWGISIDRSANANIWLYRFSNGVLASGTADVSGHAASLTNANSFTISRASNVAAGYAPVIQDDLNFISGTAISLVQFQQFYTNGIIASVAPNAFYDFNEGVGDTIHNRAAANDLTVFNAPTWTSNVATTSLSNISTYTIGRDSGTGNLVYGKLELEGLTTDASASQASSYHPRDIVQTTDTLYSPLYNITSGNGVIQLGSITRAFGSYSEAVTLHTGNSTVPAHIVWADQSTGITTANIGGGASNTAVTEQFLSTAEMNGETVDGMYLSLSKNNSPTGTATIGTFDSSGNVVTTFTTLNVALLTASQATYYFQFNTPYTIQTNDRIGIKFTGGDASNYIMAYYRNSDVYDGTNAYLSRYAAGWTDSTGFDVRFGLFESHMQSVVYDSGTDSIYTFFESGTDTIRAVKRTGSTTLLGTAFSHTTGQPFSVLQLTDRIILQTTQKTYQITTSSDSVTELFDNSFNTRYPQSYSISPASQSFNTVDVYQADDTTAILYDPATGISESASVMIDSTSSATLGKFDPTRYYYLQGNDLTIEASGTSTTWTIKDVGAQLDLATTPYSEDLNISLTQNSTLYDLSVLKLVCDTGIYNVDLQYFSVGSDSDCSMWRVLAESSDTVGRSIQPYTRTADLVHADLFTTYGFLIEASSPTLFMLQSSYDGKVVDTSFFDSGGQAQQFYLFGQCYDISIIQTSDDSVITTGTACANDFTTKTIDLLGITIPDPLTPGLWNYVLNRNGTNPLSNIVISNVTKSTTPFNATITVSDHFMDAHKTFENVYNFTNVDSADLVLTGINANTTLYYSVHEEGDNVLNFQSTGNFLGLNLPFDSFGLLFGIPVASIFLVFIAAIFTRSNAAFGLIVVAAVAGAMVAMGMLEFEQTNIWTLIMVIVAVGVFGARRYL